MNSKQNKIPRTGCNFHKNFISTTKPQTDCNGGWDCRQKFNIPSAGTDDLGDMKQSRNKETEVPYYDGKLNYDVPMHHFINNNEADGLEIAYLKIGSNNYKTTVDEAKEV